MNPYAELHCTSNFSFLRGASHPEEFVREAARLGHQAVAITDENSLAGVVRAHVAAKEAGIRLVIGARITLDSAFQSRDPVFPSRDRKGAVREVSSAAPPLPHGRGSEILGGSEMSETDLLLYPTDRAAYGRLARLITVGRRRASKGHCRLTLADLVEHGEGQIVVALPPRRCDTGFIERLRTLRDVFRDRCHLAIQRLYTADDEGRCRALGDIARTARVPLVATSDAHYHAPDRRPLQDVLTCIREGCTISDAGYRLSANAERHLKPPDEMARLFRELPDAVARTVEIADRCRFSLDELRYEYPIELTPPGMTPLQYLTQLAWQGAAARFPDGLPDKVRRQIEHELRLIAELRYEAYFLTVHDIVAFARSRGILCQGRGSAANSAVCYCIGVTSVDPARIDVLFERFVSRERNEPPDIDVDFEHERREEVIQYIYGKYGRHRAGLTAVVTTYRARSAVRDVGKALGLPLDAVDRLAKRCDWWDGQVLPEGRFAELGLPPADRTLRLLTDLARTLAGFPRHLSQHVGGFVITRGPLCELVPIENAAMPDRTVIQWNKDDIEALGLLKVDVLGLGMLTCINRAFLLIEGQRDEGTKGQRDKGNIETRTGDSNGAIEDVSRFDYVAESHGPGSCALRSNAEDARRRALWPDAADAPSGGLDSLEHRGRLRAAGPSGLSSLPAHRARLAGGTDDAVRTGVQPEDALHRNTVVEPDRRSRPRSTGAHYEPPAPERSQESIVTSVPSSLRPFVPLSLSSIPPEDPAVYDMICDADTIGVFQIESRGQMSMLPRLKPRNFYDLVIEVAILRPGPIQGNMVHTFLRRRHGLEPVTYPSEAVRGVLEKTLGVPLFQEQVMRLAVVAAGFTAGEADKLRRAMASWGREGVIEKFRGRFIAGMLANGYGQQLADQLFEQILGFGGYGFPESHAASFALLVYASAWLKRYHPAAFAAALLNSQPMGFYAPAQIVADARKHGVNVRPVDVNASDWDCTLEESDLSLRLGLRMVKGLSRAAADALVSARRDGPFRSIAELLRRSGLRPAALKPLAQADAFGGMGLSRRAALWQLLEAHPSAAAEPLLAPLEPCEPEAPLPPMPLPDRVLHDYRALGLSLEAHPVELLRQRLRKQGVVTAAEVKSLPARRWVRIAGLVVCRQRPETAHGVLFVTLEDETGMANVIVRPEIFEQHRAAWLHSAMLCVAGPVERQGAVIHVMARGVADWTTALPHLRVASHDFH